VMPGLGQRRRSLLNLRCGEVRHEKKQKGVGGNVQIEIDEAMHKKPAAGHQTGELQGPGKGIVELAQSLHGFGQQDADEPGATQATGNASFRKGLQIVVVSVIDDLPIVESFIGRIDDLQRA